MSVGSRNPFALLDEDEAPGVNPKIDDSPAPTQPTQPLSKTTQKHRGGGPASRGGKYYPRGGKTQTPKESEEPVAEHQKNFDGPKEGGRDGRGSRGRGRGRGAPGSRGRPFDRHSQTGKTDSDKKIHQSWGGDDGGSELKTEEAATFDAAAEKSNWGTTENTNEWNTPTADTVDDWSSAAPPADTWDTPAEVPNDAWTSSEPVPAEGDAKPEQGRGRKDRDVEEEDNTLTLDQYLAQQKEKESIIPKLESIRKVNEDNWGDVIPLTKSGEEDSYYVGKTKNAPKARAKKEEKVYIEIDARFDRPERGRGRGRGDRGRGGDRGERGDRGDRGERGDRGDRGRGDRGARRGGKSARYEANGPAPTLDVEDKIAFPSLA